MVAVAGPRRRELARGSRLGLRLPMSFTEPRMVMPGVVATRPRAAVQRGDAEYDPLVVAATAEIAAPDGPPLVVIADDSEFAARSLENWLWVTFTVPTPASDVYGVGRFFTVNIGAPVRW